MNVSATTPPLPGDEHEMKRRQHSALRRRMLEGCWDSDARLEVQGFFPAETVTAMGTTALDLSKCLLDKAASDLAVGYHAPPKIAHELLPRTSGDGGGDDHPALQDFVARLNRAGLWQIQQDTERYLWAIRQAIVRADWVPERKELLCRPVHTDLVYLDAPDHDPDQPDYVIEARQRMIVDESHEKKLRWTWDEWSIRGGVGRFRVLWPKDGTEIEKAVDLTKEVYEGKTFEGADYPIVVDGRPALPYVLYHARRNGKLWDAFRNRGLVAGTLRASAFYTFWGYLLRDASHPQRVTLDCEADTGHIRSPGTTGAIREIPLNATSILPLTSKAGASGRIDAWQPGADPERVQLAIRSYVIDVLADVGLQVEASERSGGPESGWAISLRRSSIQAKQEEQEPQLRRGDEQLLALAAGLLNRYAEPKTQLPERGWNVTYCGLPPTPAEVQAEMQQAQGDVALGIASPVDLVMARHPGWSREQAEEHLNRVATERRLYPSAAQ